MSKTKATTAARNKPTLQDHAAVSLPELPPSEPGFKTHWQGGNPFDRLDYTPKPEKASRR